MDTSDARILAVPLTTIFGDPMSSTPADSCRSFIINSFMFHLLAVHSMRKNPLRWE